MHTEWPRNEGGHRSDAGVVCRGCYPFPMFTLLKGSVMAARSHRIALMLALALALPFSVGCSSGTPSAEQEAEPVEQTKEEEVKLTEDDVAVTEETTIEAPDATSVSALTALAM